MEVGYETLARHRRRGHGPRGGAGAVGWAAEQPGVATFVASVSPANTASLELLRSLGFTPVGRQWDDRDGEELVLHLPAR